MKTQKSARAEHRRLSKRLHEVNAPVPSFRRWARGAGFAAASPKLARILAVVAMLLLVACGPDPAPWAPDCPQDDAGECIEEPDAGVPCGDERDASADKHGAQGAATVHGWGVAQIEGHQFDLCDPGGFNQYQCWWRHGSYNLLHLYTNVPPAGQLPRTRTLRKVTWSYCWSFQGETTWDTLPAGTAWVCTPGHCIDVTNRHTPGGGSCRSGTLIDELPMTVQPWSYSTIEMWVTPQAWWIGNPQGGVWMNLSSVTYTDGPN